MRYLRETVFNAADADGVASQTSAAIPAEYIVAASVVVTAVGGTITGTLKIEASNDAVTASSGAPTNWVAVTSATVSVTAAGQYLIPKLDMCYEWIRLVYTKTTSASGAKITANLKTIGF